MTAGFIKVLISGRMFWCPKYPPLVAECQVSWASPAAGQSVPGL